MYAKRIHILANVLFFLGILLGLALAIAAAWADFEGLSYFATGAGYQGFNGLHCPVLMSPSETATVSASFDNPSDQNIQPYYEVEISGRTTSRNLEAQLTVPPRAERNVAWTVGARDMDLGSFVFVKIDILPVAGYSTREATCGILTVDLAGMSGTLMLYLAVGLSLTGLVAGLSVPAWGQPPDKSVRADHGPVSNLRPGSRAAGIATTMAMLTALLGWWLVATIFCAVSILLLVIILREPTA